jgi:ADP-ribose pyrophosphatase YjhB (NUDIX family)
MFRRQPRHAERMVREGSDFRERHLRGVDFLGSFGVLESDAGVLMVQNRRRIGGIEVPVWDLPGGQVEPGELLGEALARELREEIGVELAAPPRFLFFQEGEKVTGGQRDYAWRSFFYAVPAWHGEPVPRGEILGVRWVRREAMAGLLAAPYHDSFLRWLREGGAAFDSAWRE